MNSDSSSPADGTSFGASWQSVCINCAHLDRRGPMGEEWHCAAITIGRNRIYAVTARSVNSKSGRCGPDAKLFAPAKALAATGATMTDEHAAPTAPAYVPLSDEDIGKTTGLDYGDPNWHEWYIKYRAIEALVVARMRGRGNEKAV